MGACSVVAVAVALLGWLGAPAWAAPAKGAHRHHSVHPQHGVRPQLQQQLRRWLSVKAPSPTSLAHGARQAHASTVHSGLGKHRSLARSARVSKAQASHRAQRLGRRVADGDDLIPDIRPVAPLPKVFRKVRLSSQPSGVRVVIKADKRIFACLPANRTPCTFEATGQGSMEIDITVILSSGRSVRYRRAIEGSSVTVDVWLLKIPQASNNATILTPRRISGGTSKPTKGSGVVRWVLIGGLVVVVGGAVAGVVYAVKSQENLSFRLRR